MNLFFLLLSLIQHFIQSADVGLTDSNNWYLRLTREKKKILFPSGLYTQRRPENELAKSSITQTRKTEMAKSIQQSWCLVVVIKIFFWHQKLNFFSVFSIKSISDKFKNETLFFWNSKNSINNIVQFWKKTNIPERQFQRWAFFICTLKT